MSERNAYPRFVVGLCLLSALASVAGALMVRQSERATVARLDALEKTLGERSEEQAPRGRGACAAIVDPSSLQRAVEQVLKEELARLPRNPDRGGPAAKADAEPREKAEPEMTPEMVAAEKEAHRLVADARSRHRWGEDDVRTFRGLLARVHPSAHQQVALELVRAINNDEVKLETASPF